MLLRATQNDKDALEHAVATMPLWWDSIPQQDRHNIDFRVDYWAGDHGYSLDDPKVRKRKVQMLLPKLKYHRSGAQKLGASMRITA